MTFQSEVNLRRPVLGDNYWFVNQVWRVVKVGDVPEAYWKEHRAAWLLPTGHGPTHLEDLQHASIKRDYRDGYKDALTIIPISFLEPEHNEWGEVCP